MMTRDEILQLEDVELLKQCRVDSFRGVGPGGQKRNKTESAVRVVHEATQLAGFDDTSRSQHQNKHNALKKLRLVMALHLRDVPRVWSDPVPSPKNEAFSRWVGVAFDALAAAEFKISDAASFLGLSTSKFGRLLQEIPAVWQCLNGERAKRGLPPLRGSK